MNRSAVLHIPLSQYAFGLKERTVVIRLRSARDDLKSVRLFFGDRACRLTPVTFTAVEMQRIRQSELHDYFEAVLTDCYQRLCYYFELSGGKETVLYYGDRFEETPVDDRSEYFQLPFVHRADLAVPPAWAKDAMIYNIFPDSFATGRRYISNKETTAQFGDLETHGKRGGTLRGIIENVDYLAGLGFNAIYINPIFAAGEYHKYDLIDYFHVDPCFGTNEELRELVAAFHANGIRVIIDGVFNHCGWRFFAFEDVVRNGEASPYRDWFYDLTFPVIRPEDPEAYPGYACFGYERMMPKLAGDHPAVIEYFCRVAKYWIEEFHIDGWRLDVASEQNDLFWRSFRRAVKEADPNAILIGEVWESAAHWLDPSLFDSTMNYDFRRHCRRFFAEETEDAFSFDGRVTDMLMRYRTQSVYAQLNLLDSHDVSRFLSLCNGDLAKYRLALLFQFTFPGMPSVFYGDECGIEGILEDDYRAPMIWDRAYPLQDFLRELLSLRGREEALRSGAYRTVLAERGSRVYGYERYTADSCLRVILNLENCPYPAGPELLAGEVLLCDNFNNGELGAKGFSVIRRA